MSMRAVIASAVAIFAAATGAAIGQSTPPQPGWPAQGQLLVGTNYQPVDRSPEEIHRDIALMKQAGFKVVRMGDLSWDYFRGISPGEVDAYQRSALVGLRPTWKLGDRSSGPNPKMQFYFRGAYVDPALVFNDGPGANPRGDQADKRSGKDEKPERKRSKMQLAALETLHLEPDATLQDIKARFKELVKRFHPDANGGDRGAEERLRQVIKAYGQLRSTGYS